MRTGGQMTLDKCKIGSQCIITKVNGQGELRLRLLDMGLIPNTKVEVVKFAPLGDPMEIHIRSYELTLRLDDAKQIDVKGISK
jgi:Fe2+ transport system protein FeoA